MSKELYIAEFERLMAEMTDAGVPESEAYERASEKAYDSMRERLADKTDELRKRLKGE